MIGIVSATRGLVPYLLPLSWGLAGCAANLPPKVPAAAASRARPTQVVADWDDVVAAAWAAAPRVELTIANTERPDPNTQVIELVSARDQVGFLTARRDPIPDGTPAGSDLERGEGVSIFLEFTLGRFGDPAVEWAFLTDLVDRMEQLKGVNAAPLRWRAR